MPNSAMCCHRNRFLLWLSRTWVFGVIAVAAAAQAAGPWTGPAAPGESLPAAEIERQFAVLEFDLRRADRLRRVAAESVRADALPDPGDRDPLDIVLRRTRLLLDDLRRDPRTRPLAAEAAELEVLVAAALDLPLEAAAARRELFGRLLPLRRRIAFANPLLDFTDLVFLKRQTAALYPHMCDQFYGMAQEPGGGLFVLRGAFGPSPAVTDILANSRVENGRLAGTTLDGGPRRRWNLHYDGNKARLTGEETRGGSFLSPALSFDAGTLAFAYVECTGPREHLAHFDHPARGYWPESRCYHLFKVGLDGSQLTMLSDGTWNDFSPCWTPAGRIAFISERRGGYLRCGRTCPNYTLFDMNSEGGDIRSLSVHDTNEWAPVVGHDGLLVWTRWDYVDRNAMIAHHPWTVTPDGRNARPLHGNYSLRPTRPDMITDLQPVPGSRRFVATAAPHHGQSFGSLVLIDPSRPDDDRMGPVSRLTPEVGFPESQNGALAYGTAWPLSDDYFLAAYDPVEVPGVGRPLVFGLYLVDSFGNKELIYRDPDISCLNPIPVRPRPRPPVVPERAAAPGAHEATVLVTDVYQSKLPWPEGTRITGLRIWQLLPESVPSAALRHNTGWQIAGTQAQNPVRALIGEVPVEPDGSAWFTVPAGRQVFFQALDQHGCAVQSMRSAASFRPGEQASCSGCHEAGPRAPAAANYSTVLALQRPPSRPEPGPDGSYPFSFPRLVQPVLDRHCLPCHAADSGDLPRLDAAVVRDPGGRDGMDSPTAYTESYLGLIPYAFTDYGGGKDFNDPRMYRTTPGAFGARASKLYPLLRDGHGEVTMPAADLKRIILWLDSVSQFYGVYEPDGGRVQLEGGVAHPTLE
jgi:hypothetical protein